MTGQVTLRRRFASHSAFLLYHLSCTSLLSRTNDIGDKLIGGQRRDGFVLYVHSADEQLQEALSQMTPWLTNQC